MIPATTDLDDRHDHRPARSTPERPGRNGSGTSDAAVSAPTRQTSPSGAARRVVVERLRERRDREVKLIVAAADAVAQRAAALAEAQEASGAAAAAITELKSMGFTLEDLAEVLDVTVDELAIAPTADTGNAAGHPRPGTARPRRGQTVGNA